MKWFGESWRAPICNDAQHVDIPTGKVCIDCARDIQENDQGFLIPFNPSDNDNVEFEKCVVLHQDKTTSLIYPHLVIHLDCLLKNVGVRQ